METLFTRTLNQLREYDITQNKSLPLPEQTGTREFDQLNQVLTRLIGHAHLAYGNQKQFVENAAHELQTPLAVIRSKLDLLINSTPRSPRETASLLADITRANEHLSPAQQSLLLLHQDRQQPVSGAGIRRSRCPTRSKSSSPITRPSMTATCPSSQRIHRTDPASPSKRQLLPDRDPDQQPRQQCHPAQRSPAVGCGSG